MQINSTNSESIAGFLLLASVFFLAQSQNMQENAEKISFDTTKNAKKPLNAEKSIKLKNP
jgi:hypothetical protein